MTLSPRQRNAQRLLDVTYGHYGVGLTYFRGEAELFQTVGRVTVKDAEEGLDGAAIEAEMKGFTLRLRRHTCPDDFTPQPGDLITIDEPLLDYVHFHVDSKARAFGRGGYQHIVGLTPTTDPSDVAPSAPAGLPFS